MRNINTRIVFTNLLLFFCVVLSGCFFTQSGDSEDNISAEEFQFDHNKKYKIEFMMWGAANEINNYSAIIDNFMDEYPNVTVSVTTQDATQYMPTLTGRISGKMPDVFYLPEFEFRTWVDSGRLLSITNGIKPEEYSKLWPTAIDWYSYNRATKKLGVSEGSNLYCLPKDIGPWTLMYNVDMINEMVGLGKLTQAEADLLADFYNPITWDKFNEIAVKIQNYYGVEKNNSNFYSIPYYESTSAIWSNNADYFDEGAMHSTINTPEFSQAIEWIWDLIHTHKVMPLTTGDTAQNMFLAKNSAFCWVGPYLTPMYHEQNMNYRLMPVPYNGDNPQAKSTSWIGTLGLAISKTTTEPAASLELLKYLSANENSQKDLVNRGQLIPNIKSLALDKEQFLNSDAQLATIWPENKELYLDIVDGNTGETRAALGKLGADLVDGRVRPHYHTFENSWLNAVEVELGEIYSLKNKAEIATRLSNFHSVLQEYLDASNKSGGVY